MTRCGTVNYMAPEVHYCIGHGRAADFWSFGAFAFDMMCADFPVKSCQYKVPIKYPAFLSKEAVSLLQGLLQTGELSADLWRHVVIFEDAQWIAFALPDPAALGLIPSVPDNLFLN